MKKFSATALACLMMAAMPTASSAQTQLEKAFKQFIKENKVSTNEIKAKPAGKRKFDNYLSTYTFTLKGKDTQRIQPILDAFSKDEDEAYNVIRQTDGDHKGIASLTLTNYPMVIVGEKYDNSTLMCFADPADSTYRYAYAIEWDNDHGSSDNYMKGRLTTSYSVRPTGRRETRNETFGHFSFPSLYFDKKHRGTVYQNIGKLGSLEDINKAKKEFEKSTGWQLEQIDSLVRNGQTLYNIDGRFVSPDEMYGPTWLSQFNSMRRLIEKHPNNNSTSYYVSTIYDLCKHAGRLDADERKLVVDEINRLSQLVSDSFLKKMLAQSAENVRKAKDEKE